LSRTLSREDFIAWGKEGVLARMRKLTAGKRREVARKAARVRWAKKAKKRKLAK